MVNANYYDFPNVKKLTYGDELAQENCRNVEPLELRDTCILNNLMFYDHLTGEYFWHVNEETCTYIQNSEGKDRCLAALAWATGDTSLCKYESTKDEVLECWLSGLLGHDIIVLTFFVYVLPLIMVFFIAYVSLKIKFKKSPSKNIYIWGISSGLTLSVINLISYSISQAWVHIFHIRTIGNWLSTFDGPSAGAYTPGYEVLVYIIIPIIYGLTGLLAAMLYKRRIQRARSAS